MRVLFSTAILPQYRIPFHEGVRTKLASIGISYDVVFGQPNAAEALKGGLASLPWGKQVVNRHYRIGAVSAVWQPILREAWAADLVIIGQENRLLTNYLIQGLRRSRRPKVALWGHGRNFQRYPERGVGERWKRVWATQCDWWFAYTEESRKTVERYGFPPTRITVFHNAIDTSEISRHIARLADQDLASLETEYGVNRGKLGVYVGGIYDHKRIDFLIEAAKEVRRRVPEFSLLIVGDGMERDVVKAAANQHSWIRYLGPLFGPKKAEILRLARVFMMPGLVGLAILDCAAAGLPIVTTAYPYHSPEIEYLKPGRNGLMVTKWRDPMAYADAVVSVLCDDELHAALVAGAREVGDEYTIERMVDCFCEGVTAALRAPKLARLD